MEEQYRVRHYSRILGKWEFAQTIPYRSKDNAIAYANREHKDRWVQVLDQNNEVVYDRMSPD